MGDWVVLGPLIVLAWIGEWEWEWEYSKELAGDEGRVLCPCQAVTKKKN